MSTDRLSKPAVGRTEAVVWGQEAVAATLKPTAGGTDASSLTDTANDNPIALLCRLVGFKPLDTSPKGERCRCGVSGKLEICWVGHTVGV